VLTQSTLASRGTPQNPWPQETITAKYMRNVRPILGEERAEQLRLLTIRLPDLGEVSTLAGYTATAAAQAA
jgi:hypothetical protein